MTVSHPSRPTMPTFLMIASLSLAFYLGLLVFLYRDGRKRRPRGGSVYKVEARSVAELGPRPAMVYEGPSPRRQRAATVLVRFAGDTGYGRLKPQVAQGEAAKVITLPTLARGNKDAHCG